MLLTSSNDKVECKIEKGVLLVNDQEFDIPLLRKWADAALRVLCTGNSATLMKRQTWIWNFLPQQYHHLIKASNPITNELLGSNLDQKVNDLQKLSEVAKKLNVKKHRRGITILDRKGYTQGHISEVKVMDKVMPKTSVQ